LIRLSIVIIRAQKQLEEKYYCPKKKSKSFKLLPLRNKGVMRSLEDMMERNSINLKSVNEMQSMLTQEKKDNIELSLSRAAKNKATKSEEKLQKYKRQNANYERSLRNLQVKKLKKAKDSELIQQYLFKIEDSLLSRQFLRCKSNI
jgi:hypothetical protein